MITWWKHLRESLEVKRSEKFFRTNVWFAIEGKCPFCNGILQNHCFMELGGYQLPKTNYKEFIAQELVKIAHHNFSGLDRLISSPLPIFELMAWRCDKEASPFLIALIIPLDDTDRWIFIDSSREHGNIRAPAELIDTNKGSWICFGKRD